jgi:fibronectin-binding autotransporter adhesin
MTTPGQFHFASNPKVRRAKLRFRKKFLGAAAAGVLGSLALAGDPRASAQTLYQFTPLNGYSADAINDSGTVVGYSYSAQAFTYSIANMTYTDLGSLPGGNFNNYASAINNAPTPTVVGYSGTLSGYDQAFSYTSPGPMTDLGSLPGGLGSYATGINDSGTVVGYARIANDDHAFSYSDGTMTDLGTLGGTSSYAFGINDSGTVVGYSHTPLGYFHAFSDPTDTPGAMVDLGTLPGGLQSFAEGINNSGTVVGEAGTSGGSYHAFSYSDGTMTDLGTLGGSNSNANAVNNSGVIVGSAQTSNGGYDAFIYSNGVMSDLNSLAVNLPKSWTSLNAIGINNFSDIVGFGTNAYDYEQAFLLTPITSDLYWNNAAANGQWDISTSANWINTFNHNEPADYSDGALVNFTDTNGPGGAALAPSAYNVTLNTTVNPVSVVVNNNDGNYVISGTGSIAGFANLVKEGSDSLSLSTANTYSGGTTIGDGTLIVGNDSAIPLYSDVTFGDGIHSGTLDLNGFGATVESLTTAASGSGTITNNGTQAATLTIYDDNNTFSGDITDGSSPTALVVGYGSLTLSGANNTFSGGVAVYNNGTLVAGATNAFGSGPIYVGGLAVLNGFNQSVGGLGGYGEITNGAAGNAVLTVGGSGGSYYSGILSDGTNGGSLSLVINTSGTQTLGGPLTYSGSTAINSGATLEIAGNNTDTFSGAVSGGGNLYVDNYNAATLALTGAVSYAGYTYINDNATLQISGANTDLLPGSVQGNGNLVVGDGVTNTNLTLSSSNNYFSGAVTINSGSSLQAAGYLGNATLSSGTLAVYGATADYGSYLNLDSLTAASGTLAFNIANYNSDNIDVYYSANLSGTLAFSFNLVPGALPYIDTNDQILYAGNLSETIGNFINGIGPTTSYGRTLFTPFVGGSTPAGDANAYSYNDPNSIYVYISGSVGPDTLYWAGMATNSPGNGDGATWDQFNPSGPAANYNWFNVDTGLTDQMYQFDNVNFDDYDPNYPVGNFNVTLNTTVSPGSVTVDNYSNNYVISGTGSIAGATSLLKEGYGSLTLSTANTYSGGTTIAAGTLIVGNASAIPVGSSVTFGDMYRETGFLDLNGIGATVGALAVAAGGYGNITNNGTQSATLTFAGGTNPASTFSGEITDGGSQTALLVSSGSLTLSGKFNYFSGGVTVNGGTLIAGVVNYAFGEVEFGSNLTVNGGAVELAGFNESVDSLQGIGGAITNSSPNPATLIFGGYADESYTFSGSIFDGAGGGPLSLQDDDFDTEILNGPLSYTGSTDIFYSTLQISGPNTDTLSGDITGDGFLIVGDGTTATSLTLSGANNTYAFGTDIYANSTLIGAATNAFGPGSLYLSGGAVQLDGFNESVNYLQGYGSITNGAAGDATLAFGGGNYSIYLQGSIADGGAGKLSLVFNGAGTENLYYDQLSYTGTTTINSGTLDISDYTSETLSGAVSGAGNLIVGFEGGDNINLTLSNPANNLTGDLNIDSSSSGVLQATGSFGDTTLTQGTLEATGATPGAGTLTLKSLTTTGGNLLFNVGNGANADLITVTNIADLANGTTISFNLINGAMPTAKENVAILTSTDLLLGNDFTPGDLASLVVGGIKLYAYKGDAALGFTDNGAEGTNPNDIYLYVGSAATEMTPTTLYWNNAAGNGQWDINTSANWNDTIDSVNPATYADADSINFDDAHNTNGNYNVSLNTTVNPASVTVNNSAGNYVISGTGDIAGSTGLLKEGIDKLTLSTANTYTGDTTISGGTLALGATGSIADSAVINVQTTGIFDVSAVNGGFTLGALVPQTLEGTGNVTGSITVDPDGTLSPGDAIGALTVSGNVTLTPLSNIAAQVTPVSGVNDELIATNIYLGGATGTITATGALTNGESFTVIQGHVYGWFSDSGSLPALGAGLSWNQPLQINNALPGAASTYQQNIVLSVTNGTPLYSSTLPASDTYAGLNITDPSGRNTNVTFLGGTVSTGTTLAVQFANRSGNNPDMISDVATISGTGTDTYVLELNYIATDVTNGTLSPVLAVEHNNVFEAAVLLDPTQHEVAGAYNPSTDDVLGDYGIDPTNHEVWAVLDYSGGDEFGVYQRIPGDLTGSGTVTPSDLGLVQTNLFGSTGGLWSRGDFQGAGLPTDTVTPGDLALVQTNLFATEHTGGSEGSDGGLITSSPVPEPGSLGLIAIGSLGLMFRRRSKYAV